MDARATDGLETGATLQPLQNHAVTVLVLQLYLLPDGEKGQRPSELALFPGTEAPGSLRNPRSTTVVLSASGGVKLDCNYHLFNEIVENAHRPSIPDS